MQIDPQTLPTRDAYALLTSFVVPRPIAWVSTQGPNGETNVAPFSYFSGLCSRPLLVTLGIANLRDGSPKDTLRWARATGVLCINLVEEALVDEMNQTSAEYPLGVSEFRATGLTPVPCAKIACVRVGEARAALECRLMDVHRYGEGAGVNLVVAEVVSVYVEDRLLGADGKSLDPAQIAPVARLGGAWYGTLGERFQRARPQPPEGRS